MKNQVFIEHIEAITLSRLDLTAFIVAFLTGLSFYVILHFTTRVF